MAFFVILIVTEAVPLRGTDAVRFVIVTASGLAVGSGVSTDDRMSGSATVPSGVSRGVASRIAPPQPVISTITRTSASLRIMSLLSRAAG